MSRCIIPLCRLEDAQDLCEAGPQRIQSIIAASKARGDTIHHQLEEQLQDPSTTSVTYHRSCVSSYTSKQHISSALKRTSGGHDRSKSEPPKENAAQLHLILNLKYTVSFVVPCVRKRILKIQPDGDGLSNAGLPIDQARDSRNLYWTCVTKERILLVKMWGQGYSVPVPTYMLLMVSIIKTAMITSWCISLDTQQRLPDRANGDFSVIHDIERCVF